ncbi:hypothetical protein [Spirillospora sp. NBC_01491]|uniref:hypothetical protein n=1 Tax=Spirillospora sp. NBC_01491 TaxID=2976007 RepID=UPI002E3478E5|nr:hypothetical protein [Spirillospora sp. NBC_01491]
MSLVPASLRALCAPALASAVLAPAAPAVASPARDPIPAYATRRLERVAGALAKDPLFVDPDMAAALDRADRARVRAAIGAAARQIGTPVFVVVIPNPAESESEGHDGAFLSLLHDRTHRDGLYLMANSHAWFNAVGYGVPREVSSYEEGEAKRDSEHPFNGLAGRLVARLDLYRNRPATTPREPYAPSRPDAFGEENRWEPAEAEITGPLLTGLLLAGPFGALALYGLGAGGLFLWRRRGTRGPVSLDKNATPVESHPGAPARPSVKWLVRTGAKELERLRLMLSEAGDPPGRGFAVTAYDAAKILYDDAAAGRDRALDLVGAIVLARQGLGAIAQKTASPPPPCFVNPLHGPSAHRRQVRLDGETGPGRRRPLCAACNARPVAALARQVLEVSGPDGPRPHHAVPGVWQDTAFGADGNDLVPRVLEYLGVE